MDSYLSSTQNRETRDERSLVSTLDQVYFIKRGVKVELAYTANCIYVNIRHRS